MVDQHDIAKCPHCNGEIELAAVTVYQTFTIAITASESTRVAAVTVGETIAAFAKSVEETGLAMGQRVTVFLESVTVTDGRVEITMSEAAQQEVVTDDR